jgi:hypothetical protein
MKDPTRYSGDLRLARVPRRRDPRLDAHGDMTREELHEMLLGAFAGALLAAGAGGALTAAGSG